MSPVVNEQLLRERLVNRSAEIIRATGRFNRLTLVRIAPPVGLNLNELEELFRFNPDDDGFTNLVSMATEKANRQYEPPVTIAPDAKAKEILDTVVALTRERDLEKPLSRRKAGRLFDEGVLPFDVPTIEKIFAVGGLWGWHLFQTAQLEIMEKPVVVVRRPESAWKGRERPWTPLDVSRITVEPFEIPKLIHWTRPSIIERGALLADQVGIAEAFTTKQMKQLADLRVFPSIQTISSKYPEIEGQGKISAFRAELQTAIDHNKGIVRPLTATIEPGEIGLI